MPTTGYDQKFLGKILPFPKLDKKILAPLRSGRGSEIKYTHFSVFVHADRKLPMMSAVNIKGEDFARVVRDGPEDWDFSDQIEDQYQIDNTFYGKDLNTFDRGHLVRRIDPCWGDVRTAAQAEVETFRWVNCTPQHKKLNQRGGVWFQLEQHVLENGVKGKLADISVFAGPVLNANDKVFVNKWKNAYVQIPSLYWKVIVWKKSDNKLYAVGFLMDQAEWIAKNVRPLPAAVVAEVKKKKKPSLPDDYFENLRFNDNKTYQVRIEDIELATGIKFDWNNVTFPFKSRTPSAVKAVALNKVHPFPAVAKAKVRAGGGFTAKTAAKVKSALGKLRPLSSAQIKADLEDGFGGVLKRYQIMNIKM